MFLFKKWDAKSIICSEAAKTNDQKGNNILRDYETDSLSAIEEWCPQREEKTSLQSFSEKTLDKLILYQKGKLHLENQKISNLSQWTFCNSCKETIDWAF